MNPRPSRRLLLRHALVSVCVVLLCLLLNRPEVVFFSRVGFVAWYPAIGLIMALTVGISPWYALVGCFSLVLSGKIIYGQPALSFSGIVDAAGIAICYGTAAMVLRGRLRIDLELRHRRDMFRYVLVSAVAASGATIIGVACLIADHGITWHDYNAAVIAWFLGDAIGIVGIAPFLLVHVLPHVRKWLSPAPQPRPTRKRSNRKHAAVGVIAEACVQALAIVAVCWAMFRIQDGRYGRFYPCFIPIIWIAMRHGVRRVVTGLLALNFGIVVAMHFWPPTPEVFTKMGLFMLVISSTGLLVGSEVSERHRMALDLNEQTTYLKSLIQSSPFGIVVLDCQGQIEVANPAFEKLLGSINNNPASSDPARILLNESALEDSSELIPEVLAGETLQKTVRHQSKNGKFLDFAVHVVPLTVENSVCGAYVIYQDISEQTQASENERRHSESLFQLVSQLQLRAREMTLLNEMRNLLECCTTRAEARMVVARSVPKMLPQACFGNLNYLDPATPGQAKITACWGDACEVDSSFAIESCWALRRGQPHWSEPSDVGIRCTHLKEGSKSTFLCVPMMAQGSVVGGILHLEFPPDLDLASQTDSTEKLREALQRLAVSISGQAGMALSALRLREKLEGQSTHDPLTELFNRRFQDDSLEREVLRSSRSARALSIMLIDIDHFKRFNDTFGHDAGDQVLQSVANLFRTFFRASDICCRHGGEEFVIIMPDSSLQNAVIRANALRTEVKRLNPSYDGQPLQSITISIGVAAYPEHGSSAQELLKSADRCLYESKANGRDTVTAAPLKIAPFLSSQPPVSVLHK
jgi:diguanylate cyclase (GGDEF)-like protein/PAS domain S-box-containing protein